LSSNLDRRTFLKLSAGSVAASAMAASLFGPEIPARIKAVAFDAFVIFDPRPVFALTEQVFPEKGRSLAEEWRTRQFEYTWLRVVSKSYADFWQITQDALQFAANKLQVHLSREKRDQLMAAYLQLKPWPDVTAILRSLKESGLQLAFLSNFTSQMLDANIRGSGLQGIFKHVLSTDEAKTFKPDPAAYNLGLKAMKVEREEILFAAFAGWDAAGAKQFGYPTFWVNRQKLPREELDVVADGASETFPGLLDYLTREKTV